MTRNLRTRLVEHAEFALRAWFGDDVCREDAGVYLGRWRFAASLDDDMRVEVLSRFAPADPPSVPGLDYLPEVPREYTDAHGCTWREAARGYLALLDVNGYGTGQVIPSALAERKYGPLVEVVSQPHTAWDDDFATCPRCGQQRHNSWTTHCVPCDGPQRDVSQPNAEAVSDRG